MSLTIAEPDEMRSSANHTAACLGELESHLRGLVACQGELQAAVKGATGTAIYSTLGNSYEKGKDLAGFLQRIIDQLTDAGVKIDAEDLDGKAKIYAKMGEDGQVDAGTGAGSWANGAQEKVNTSW